MGEHCDARHRKWTGWANPIAQALGIADRVSQAWEGEDDPPLTSLKYLQSIYRDENQATNVRIRCAVEALPYENPGIPAKTYEHGIKERTVVVEFDSLAQAVAAHDSPAYQAALAVLGNAAERDLRIVEGTIVTQ